MAVFRVRPSTVPIFNVKDLSRFGRNYLDIGKYVEIKYPSLGVHFIAIQENIDTLKNVGTEMSRSTTSSTSGMPRRRARRYAQYGNLRQTRESGIRKQEIRGWSYTMDCGWACGESLSSHLWALYRRTWSYEDSAKIGRWENPNPNSILIANGRKAKNKISARSEYSWGTSSFEHILENRQYTGCTVNFKSSIISYEVHKKVSRGRVADYPEHPKSNYWRGYP